MVGPVIPPSLDGYRRRVESMARNGVSFAETQDVLERAEVSSAERASLWMLAWSLIGPRAQYREAKQMLALVLEGAEPEDLVEAGQLAMARPTSLQTT